jgi:hypothetical protein
MPEVSRMAVLIAGRPNAGMTSKSPPTCSGPFVGHAASNVSPRRSFVMTFAPSPPSHGTENCRAYHSAPKNAAKNMTSEKMNHSIPMRNERSTASL